MQNQHIGQWECEMKATGDNPKATVTVSEFKPAILSFETYFINLEVDLMKIKGNSLPVTCSASPEDEDDEFEHPPGEMIFKVENGNEVEEVTPWELVRKIRGATAGKLCHCLQFQRSLNRAW